ncbi:MAG: hypothetical protein RBQ97_08430 [Acholeplasma sp.]|nr:hypothetical protein [Acholeplasma sp.]
MNKEIDLEADTIKVMLLNNIHAFDGADNVLADISANEISGAGYIAGGKILAGKAVTQGAVTKWDATDVIWTDASISAYHAAFYDDTLTNKDLIASIDFGGEISVADGTFEMQWDVQGIITLSE